MPMDVADRGRVDEPTQQLTKFGLVGFRPGQRAVIDAVLAGADCLCIMPTGGGKSLCYQLPSVLRTGLTLVVSPLIALMKDQVDTLNRLGIPATFINSTMSLGDQAECMQRMAAGEYALVYVAPERFRSPRFMEALQGVPLQLLAVDEAHCISEWGHDFRHDYARLGQFRRRLGNPPTIALTATATPDVREDVIRQLELQSPKVFVAGFARPNLIYRVRQVSGKGEKNATLREFLGGHPGSGIIYSSTRRGCEEIAETISENLRRTVAVYHAGMDMEHRRTVQESFMQGRIEIVVATNAFGMGIDKPDVRFVVHYNMPGTLESYYQEAGRAGRDGAPSVCLFLYDASDRYVQEFFIENAYPPREVIQQVYQFLMSTPQDPVEMTQIELKEALRLSVSAEGVGTCERLLEKAGVLERLQPHHNMGAVAIHSDLPTVLDLLPVQAANRRKVLAAVEKIVGERRCEMVYFNPQYLADVTHLSLTVVKGDLRKLSQLQCFDYVPPFRGRALHLKRRDLPFEELAIDFEGLDRRRQLDYEKLDCVVRYAKTTRCRQREILNYFQDQQAADCGQCDNCQRRSGSARGESSTRSSAAAVGITPEVGDKPCGDHAMNDATVQVIRKALSGVARARTRFGKQLIAAMLAGSSASKVARWKLNELTTFGLLRHMKQADIIQLLDLLVAADLLECVEIDRFRPVMRLTAAGDQFMRTGTVTDGALRLPPNVLAKLVGPTAAASRIDQASDPAPGPLSPTVASPPVASRAASPSPRVAPNAPPAVETPDYYWTWRLLSEGYTPEQCQKVRGYSADQLWDQACQALAQGLTLEVRRLFSESHWRWLELHGREVPPADEPSTRALPDGLEYHHVRLYQLTMQS